ncbi:MAG: ParA family protein [Planctomycetes bacterium]|nr:ParA family protein [Planctomycetota bacterium]
MQILSVANQKGGVAKTTTALSLATSLAQQGFRVLAVDMDPQENLSAGFGVELEDGDLSLFEVLARKAKLADAVVPVELPGIDALSVLPAGPRLAQAEAELLGQVGFDELLKFKLAQVADAYDYVVLDCPPSLGALTINALGASQLVVVPVQCEFFSARGVAKLMEVVELVQERRNPTLQVRLVPTLFDKRNKISKVVLSELVDAFGARVSKIAVGVDTRVREAQVHGLPVSIYAPRSRASLAYEALACEVHRTLQTQLEGRAHGQAA